MPRPGGLHESGGLDPHERCCLPHAGGPYPWLKQRICQHKTNFAPHIWQLQISTICSAFFGATFRCWHWCSPCNCIKAYRGGSRRIIDSGCGSCGMGKILTGRAVSLAFGNTLHLVAVLYMQPYLKSSWGPIAKTFFGTFW